jgi:hypothetical protein
MQANCQLDAPSRFTPQSCRTGSWVDHIAALNVSENRQILLSITGIEPRPVQPTASLPTTLPPSSRSLPTTLFRPKHCAAIAGTGRSGDRIPVGARFSASVQTGPGPHPASCTMGTVSFPGVKIGRGVTLTPYPLLVPWSRKSRAIPVLHLWAVRPVQSLSARTEPQCPYKGDLYLYLTAGSNDSRITPTAAVKLRNMRYALILHLWMPHI